MLATSGAVIQPDVSHLTLASTPQRPHPPQSSSSVRSPPDIRPKATTAIRLPLEPMASTTPQRRIPHGSPAVPNSPSPATLMEAFATLLGSVNIQDTLPLTPQVKRDELMDILDTCGMDRMAFQAAFSECPCGRLFTKRAFALHCLDACEELRAGGSGLESSSEN